MDLLPSLSEDITGIYNICSFFHQSVAMLVGLQRFESEVVLISLSSAKRDTGWVHELVIQADDLQQQWMDHFNLLKRSAAWELQLRKILVECFTPTHWSAYAEPTCICTGVHGDLVLSDSYTYCKHMHDNNFRSVAVDVISPIATLCASEELGMCDVCYQSPFSFKVSLTLLSPCPLIKHSAVILTERSTRKQIFS